MKNSMLKAVFFQGNYIKSGAGLGPAFAFVFI